MLIECTYGPVTTEVMGTSYTFSPDEFGRNVAEIWDRKHIEALTAVVHYRLVPKEPIVAVLNELNPSEAEIGSADVTLNCTGDGFLDGSVIVFNGGVEPTTFISHGHLTTIVRPSTAEVAGSFPVLIRATNGEETGPLSFTFTGTAPLKSGKEAPAADEPIPVTEITGIGKALAAKLAEHGITDVRQIAKLTPKKAQALDDELELGGRIERDGWVEQAKARVG